MRRSELTVHRFLKDFPIVRAYLHSSVPYHVGSVWGNRLGLQVFRTVGQYLRFKARRRSVAGDVVSFVNAMDADGIALIENFLEPAQFAEVRAESDEAFKNTKLMPYKQGENARLYRTQITLSEPASAGSKILELFRHNDMLNRIAAASLRRKITRPPEVHLDWYQVGDGRASDNDIENILHADLHTATIKMFFYLDDVDESNGAFIYAKGSHRLTLSRLRHEYELSIRQAKSRTGVTVEESLLAIRGGESRNVIHPRYRRMMKVEESQMCVKANTLVIANNMGFHRRGEFPSQRPRRTVQINYRYLEGPLGKSFFQGLGK